MLVHGCQDRWPKANVDPGKTTGNTDGKLEGVAGNSDTNLVGLVVTVQALGTTVAQVQFATAGVPTQQA